MKTILFSILGLSLFLSGCLIIDQQRTPPPRPADQTQLQKRQFQQREFDSTDVKTAMKSVLSVLQDDGFTVKNAVVDLGLLSAIKETQITNGTSSTRTTTTTSSASDDFWESIFRAMGGRNNTRERTRTTTEQPQRFEKFKTVEATVYVEEFGKKIRVRASFTAKILDNFGDPMQVNEVDDMKFYQEFFLKIDKGLFLTRQKL